MTQHELLDLYSEYLISSFGATTATGLSHLLEGDVGHDQITRFLASPERTAAELWQLVKPHVRRIQSNAGVLIVDDRVAEKPFSDENEIICWHYDHAKQKQVKGINFMTALYHRGGVSLSVGFTGLPRPKCISTRRAWRNVVRRSARMNSIVGYCNRR